MAPEEDDRYGVDFRDSPPSRSWSHRRTPEDEELLSEGRVARENGDRYKEVWSHCDRMSIINAICQKQIKTIIAYVT